ncbi:hypothetical protein [Limibacillus halophilus]|uniref:Uncharacterized protein n=1 Tax=Limibacillus halophilus TaxID=1579333 RepID=A0A839SVW8_9PROT|nr:hypothetical protein [Limibacillus halophilus]MBB3066941.1 hypothetical protein [Limibacillus halophilus]
MIDSIQQAVASDQSLGILRPRNTRFIIKKKSVTRLEDERKAFRSAARQTQLFDKSLAELEPSPYDFRFEFYDSDGKHNYSNGDWEAHAMFWRERNRTSEARALQWMNETFNEAYPQRGMAFAIGNQKKRPQTWQLLGVIRLDHNEQLDLDI